MVAGSSGCDPAGARFARRPHLRLRPSPRDERAAGSSRRLATWLPSIAIGLALLFAGAPARADDQQAFELAKNPFDAGQFAEAHARLSALLDPALPPCDTSAGGNGRCRITDPDLIERARALDAASLLAQKREAEADAQIAKILRKNPQYAPNPALFPQEVVDRFTMVRGTLRPELEAIAQQKARDELAKRVASQKARDAEEKWIAELERRAGEEKRVLPNSRWIAMVPFGVGQFQNGDTALGVVFATSEALVGTASLVLVAVMNKLASQCAGLAECPQAIAVTEQIRVVTVANQITFSAWAAITAAGIAQAQIGFVPERTTTVKRPVPPRPKMVPVAAPIPGGVVFGLSGVF